MRLNKALVIESNPQKREIIKSVLANYGFDVDAPETFIGIVNLALTSHDYELVATAGRIASFEDKLYFPNYDLIALLDHLNHERLKLLYLDTPVNFLAQMEILGMSLLLTEQVDVESFQQLSLALKESLGRKESDVEILADK